MSIPQSVYWLLSKFKMIFHVFKKKSLQATSVASFKWRLAVNKNSFCLCPCQEFVNQSQRLLSDHALRERVVRNGKLYVEEHHSLEQERETYQQLVDSLL